MIKRNPILMLGIFAIIVLITAQFFIIREVWNQKDEMLSLRYRSYSQDAIGSMRMRRSVDVYDTVRFILDNYSEVVINELASITDSLELENKKQEIFDFFSYTLNTEQDLSVYLTDYFRRQGYEDDFKHRIEIISLDLIDMDTVHIFQDEFFRTQRLTERSQSSSPPDNYSKSSILVYRYALMDNYYVLFFEYYIDFSDKQKMILRETSASLATSIISILIVMTIFLFTYRNLMQEKRLSNLKTDFINNMTHELKTPLATITVAGKTLEIEKIRKDDSKIVETARLIGKQSVHLNQLINMILEISMWERTQFELSKKQVDIESLMHDIVDCFKNGSGDTAAVTQNYDFKGIKPEIDTVYFTTMINNLLSNSVKYCEKDPVIKIEGYVEDNNIIIRLTDNGIGISRNDQKRVFDKFYRASSGNIHKYKGLGLGLYYVKKIATAHGGDVILSSKPGKGSIFTVIIPYKNQTEYESSSS
jgi:signal transduction histidine kinase